MAIHLGADFKLYIDGSVAAHCESFSKSSERGTVEITSRSSATGWREYQTTNLKGGTIDFSGMIARPGTSPEGEVSFEDILTQYNDSEASIGWTISAHDVSSSYQDDGVGYITSLDQDYGTLEDKVTFSGSIQITGAIVRTQT